jgi:Protein of unknown function (DUF4240)
VDACRNPQPDIAAELFSDYWVCHYPTIFTTAFAKDFNMLAENEFWTIIDGTHSGSAGQSVQLATFKTLLRKLDGPELIAFENTFNEMRKRAYRWDVWGAAYVMNGGASDDGFEYFMRWLISRGRKVFEAALENPDSLANVPAEEYYEFEEFATVAADVWQEKTGIDPWQDESGRFPYTGAAPADDPVGKAFEDSPEYFESHYPKLWKRFGGL